MPNIPAQTPVWSTAPEKISNTPATNDEDVIGPPATERNLANTSRVSLACAIPVQLAGCHLYLEVHRNAPFMQN